MADHLTITSLGAQGDGVTDDGIFVPGALPGETVRVTLMGHRAELLEVVKSVPDRQMAACPHFGSCGACALQHASDGLVAGWKRDLVYRALGARGIEGIEILPVITSPPFSRRRVTLAGRRTRKGSLIGFHGAATNNIIAVDSCAVATPAILAGLPALARVVEAGASRSGEVRLSVLDTAEGLDIAAEGGKPLAGGLYGELVAIAATSDLARLSWEGDAVVTRRQPMVPMGNARVSPPPGGFLQATAEGQAALVEAVTNFLAPARRVVDLFAGSGTFALPLAQTAEVHAVESEAAALEALDIGWRNAPGLKKIGTETRDLYRRPLRAAEFTPFDGVVIDPPRQGARAQFEELAKAELSQIAAVSCNPATFARDARTLIDGGYTLDWVQPIDQFRWSHHVELVAGFTRA